MVTKFPMTPIQPDHGSSEPAPGSILSGPWPATQRVAYLQTLALQIATLLIFAAPGCSLLNPGWGKLPEYEDAKRQINHPDPDDPEWVRPEGARAEKYRDSKMGALSRWLGRDAESRRKPEEAKAEYVEADALFRSATTLEGTPRTDGFRAAAKKYISAGKKFQSSTLEQDAMFMTAESYFFAEDYPKAEDWYVKLSKEYPRNKYSDRIDSRRFEMGKFWLDYDRADPAPFYYLNFTDNRRHWNDTGGHGKRAMSKLRMDSPTGKIGDDATMVEANHYFEIEDYEMAATTYEDMRLTYPDSPHQFDAHFLGLKATLETYQGPQYSGDPLDEAEKLVKQIVQQFRQQASEQQEFINRAYAEIRYKKAERYWYQAEYRRKRQENAAARHYLEEIIEKFDDTPFKDKAAEMLASLEGLPDTPPVRLGFLVKMFPENDPIKPLLKSDAPTILR